MEINPETLEIEIVDVGPIEGGVQVFARVWSDGVQIGFGADGTVDIERFRFINPPILVPDKNGLIIVITPADELTSSPEHISKYREDPQEALLRALSEIVTTMNYAAVGATVTVGKIGNTTTTIYSSTNDGTFLSDNQVTYTLARDATAASAIDQGNGNVVHNSLISTTYYVRRFVTFFDTSPIGSDVVSSATLSVSSLGAQGLGNTDTIRIVPFTGSNPPVVGDFDLFGTTEYASKALSTFSGTAGVYNDFSLNATGIATINGSGTTVFGFRSLMDINNTTPTGQNYMRVYQADNVGTTNDPKLVVEHSAGGGGGSPTPTLMMMGIGS